MTPSYLPSNLADDCLLEPGDVDPIRMVQNGPSVVPVCQR